MKRRHGAGIMQAAAASVVACFALFCMSAVSVAADPSYSPEVAADRARELLVRGAGYGQPQGELRVRALQRRLRALGHRPGRLDGRYGPLTEAAVERLQRDSGLSVDGIVGPQTRRVLTAESPPLAPGAGYGEPGGSRQVRAVQRRLRALGQRPGPVDGLYGPRTQAAIERFQRSAGQSANGMLSPGTATALARADGDQSAGAASHTDRGDERGRQGRSSVSGAEDAKADGEPNRADAVAAAEGSDQGRSRTPTAVDDRATGTGGAESDRLVLLLTLALALATGASLLAGWLKGRRPRPQAGNATGRPVSPRPMPIGGMRAATNGARKPARNDAAKEAASGATAAATTAASGAATNDATNTATTDATKVAPNDARKAIARLLRIDWETVGRMSRNGGGDAAENGAGKAAQPGTTNRARNGARHGAAREAPNGARKAVPNDARVPAQGGAREAAKATAMASVPSSPEPGRQSNGCAALGYVSVGEPDAGGEHEFRHQTAAMPAAISGSRWETWLRATAESAGAARSIIRKAAAEAGLDGEPAWDLMVATTEAVNNAVQHGRPWPNGCVLFVTEPCPRGLRVEVSDLGTFDSTLEPAPLDATSGRGFQIIAALVDRFEVKNGDGPTVVRFEKHRGTVPAPEDPERDEEAIRGA